MLLLLSFLILEYVSSKVNPKKQIRQIESDFKNFKLAATKDELILNAADSFNLDETALTIDVLNELLHAANITNFIEISAKYRIPIQRLLYEWNYVPARDSPKHILNALNDDCIQEILLKLTDTSDFLGAAETCQQFQKNALQRYPSEFKSLSLSVENKSTNRYTGLAMDLATNYLRIFGHLIYHMELINDFDEGTLNMIAKYCGKTLSELYIKGNENTTANFNALSKFKALETIRISSLSIDSMELPESLFNIFISDVKVQEDMQFILEPLPNLKNVGFNSIANLSETTMNRFITLNPQIELFLIMNCRLMTCSVLNDISDRLQNLTVFTIECNGVITTPEYIEFLTHLTRLQRLKYLFIIFSKGLYPADILIDSLVANIPTIESLSIAGFNNLDEALTGLLGLSSLKSLNLFNGANNITPSRIHELIKGLPTLEHMRFSCSTLGVSGIMDILKYSKNLVKLEIDISEMDINLSVYEAISTSIRGRLEVTLYIKNGNIDENIFKENEQRLRIIRPKYASPTAI